MNVTKKLESCKYCGVDYPNDYAILVVDTKGNNVCIDCLIAHK